MTAIEWTHRPGTKGETWNPIVAYRWVTDEKTGERTRLRGWHCEHASTGCINCYAETQNEAGYRGGTKLPYKPGHRKDIEIELHESTLLKPLHWREPRTIFPCSMTDLFGEWVTDEMLERIFAVMALTPHHTYLPLTKRAERMRDYCKSLGRHNSVDRVSLAIKALTDAGSMAHELSHAWYSLGDAGWHFKNIWLGVSAERQEEADERIPLLLQTPAAVRFVSLEPLLGPIDLTRIPVPDDQAGKYAGHGYTVDALQRHDDLALFNAPTHLDWVITGGESGSNARPANPQWFRDIEAQCRAAGVAYFHKQNGEWVSVSEIEGEGKHFHFPDGRTVRRVGKKAAGRLLDGKEHNGFPELRP